MCIAMEVRSTCGRYWIAADPLHRAVLNPHLFDSVLAVEIWDKSVEYGIDVRPEQIDEAIKSQFGTDIPHPDDCVELVGDGTVHPHPVLTYTIIGRLADSYTLNQCECESCGKDDASHCGCGPAKRPERTVCRKHGCEWWAA